jgi:hypothetical protein
MYDLTIDRSQDPAQTRRILCWILYAVKPLELKMLPHAAAWKLDAVGPLDDGDLEDAGSLMSSCGGLLTKYNWGSEIAFIRKKLQ